MDLAPLTIPRETRAKSRAARRWRRLAVLVALIAVAVVALPRITAALSDARGREVGTWVVVRQSPLALTAMRGTAANGYVVAARRAALSADAPGRIVELRVTEGSLVEEGELVARLYQDELRAAVDGARARVESARAEAERARAQVEAIAAELPMLERSLDAARADVSAAGARLALARSDLARQGELAERHVATARARDAAVAEYDAAEAARASAEARVGSVIAELDAQRARVAVAEASHRFAVAGIANAEAELAFASASLEKTEVRAPFAGIVVLKDAEVGEVVSPNVVGGATARGAICTMVDLASLEVQVELPEASLARAVVGAPARIFLDAYPDEPYAGRVSRLWPTANRQKGTVEVRVAFEERDDRLRPELGLRVVFLTEEDLADERALGSAARPILLAPEALLERGGRRGVQLVEDGTVRFVPLELGPERFGRVVVTSGLDEGMRVVVPAVPAVADGTRVRTQG